METSLVLFILATIGLTNILVTGKIFDDEHIPLRSWLERRLGKFKDLIECHECTGFWVGMVMGLLFISYWPWYIFACGFAGAAIMHFYMWVIYLIESKTVFEIPDKEDDDNGEDGK